MSELNGAGVSDDRTRAIVIHPYKKTGKATGRAVESCLEEAVGLAAAIDLNVVTREAVSLAKINAGTYFGKGTVERFHDLVEEECSDCQVQMEDFM